MGEYGGQAGADVHEVLLAEWLPRYPRLLGLADDVDDVDVGDVVELARPGLAHGDHGECHLIGLGTDSGTGNEQSGIQGGISELGHATADGRDVLDRVRAGEVIGDDRGETVTVGATQRSGRTFQGRVLATRILGALITI